MVFKRYETAGSKASNFCVHFRNTMPIYAENLTREQNYLMIASEAEILFVSGRELLLGVGMIGSAPQGQ